MEEKISRSEVREIVTGCTYDGGEASDVGDAFYYRDRDGRGYAIYTAQSWGEDVPSDEEIIEDAEAVGFGNTSRRDAVPVGEDDEPECQAVDVILDGETCEMVRTDDGWTLYTVVDGIRRRHVIYSEGLQATHDHLIAIFNADLTGWEDGRGNSLHIDSMEVSE